MKVNIKLRDIIFFDQTLLIECQLKNFVGKTRKCKMQTEKSLSSCKGERALPAAGEDLTD